jgi:hypothetical protein
MGRRVGDIRRNRGHGLELGRKLDHYGTDVVVNALRAVAYHDVPRSIPVAWRQSGGRGLLVILQDRFVEELGALPYRPPWELEADTSPQAPVEPDPTPDELQALEEAKRIQAEREAERAAALARLEEEHARMASEGPVAIGAPQEPAPDQARGLELLRKLRAKKRAQGAQEPAEVKHGQ